MKYAKMFFASVFLIVVIFSEKYINKDPVKKVPKRYFTEAELIPQRYQAHDSQIIVNAMSTNNFFRLEGAQMYTSIVDTPRALLSRYPLAYIRSPLGKGICFFGISIGSRVYTKFSDSIGEIYLDSANLYPVDSFYHHTSK